jgi:hypothetical protein
MGSLAKFLAILWGWMFLQPVRELMAGLTVLMVMVSKLWSADLEIRIL